MARPSGDMVAAVLIPTYNESETIGALLGDLFEPSITGTKGWAIHVVVIDGNSPDGTAHVVKQAQRRYDRLHLIEEEVKAGIGAAYFRGFRYATTELNADVVVEFDGDYQHPPQTVPEMLKHIEQGADLVMGSRRVRGGSYPHVCFTNDKRPRAINPDGSQKSAADWTVGPILVRRGASLGANSTILPGVTVGCFAMVGAGAVVTRDVPAYGLVLGSPARLVGYVCACGERLARSAGAVYTCSACHNQIAIESGVE